MAAKTDRRNAIDPAVADLLGDLTRKANDRALPRKERAAKIKARDKMQARLSARVTYDLTEDLKAHIHTLALQHGITDSQMAHYLLLQGLANEPDPQPYRHPCRSPRYTHNLELSDLEKKIIPH